MRQVDRQLASRGRHRAAKDARRRRRVTDPTHRHYRGRMTRAKGRVEREREGARRIFTMVDTVRKQLAKGRYAPC